MSREDPQEAARAPGFLLRVDDSFKGSVPEGSFPGDEKEQITRARLFRTKLTMNCLPTPRDYSRMISRRIATSSANASSQSFQTCCWNDLAKCLNLSSVWQWREIHNEIRYNLFL